MGFSIINHPFWGMYPIYGTPPNGVLIQLYSVQCLWTLLVKYWDYELETWVCQDIQYISMYIIHMYVQNIINYIISLYIYDICIYKRDYRSVSWMSMDKNRSSILPSCHPTRILLQAACTWPFRIPIVAGTTPLSRSTASSTANSKGPEEIYLWIVHIDIV